MIIDLVIAIAAQVRARGALYCARPDTTSFTVAFERKQT